MRNWLVFGAAGGILLTLGMLLGAGFLTMTDDDVNPSVFNADHGENPLFLGIWKVSILLAVPPDRS